MRQCTHRRVRSTFAGSDRQLGLKDLGDLGRSDTGRSFTLASASAPVAVGVVGYTLGDGLGPMARRFGFAADHVRRFTIATADGEIRDVTAESDPDLFWAVRGGKSNFGIVTELEFGLMPVARPRCACRPSPSRCRSGGAGSWGRRC